MFAAHTCIDDTSAQLRGGFNLLFHGLGSKKHVLTAFARQWLTDGPVVVVNGYFPQITVKTVLDQITDGVMQHAGTFRSLLDQVEFIAKVLATPGQVHQFNSVQLK